MHLEFLLLKIIKKVSEYLKSHKVYHIILNILRYILILSCSVSSPDVIQCIIINIILFFTIMFYFYLHHCTCTLYPKWSKMELQILSYTTYIIYIYYYKYVLATGTCFIQEVYQLYKITFIITCYSV